jgi:hypothetical protein
LWTIACCFVPFLLATPRYSWNIAKVSFNTNQSIFWQLNCLFFNLPLQITSCYLQTFLHFADSNPRMVSSFCSNGVIRRVTPEISHERWKTYKNLIALLVINWFVHLTLLFSTWIHLLLFFFRWKVTRRMTPLEQKLLTILGQHVYPRFLVIGVRVAPF